MTILIFIGIVERRIFGSTLWHFWSENLSKFLFAGVLCGLAEHFALSKLPESWLEIILSAVIGVCIFAAAIFAIKYLSGDEKLWFKNFLKRAVVARA